MLFADPVNTLPEFITHIIASCGIGLAGIVGAKATEEVRALTHGDRRADYFDALARDVDSVRRRQELAAQAGDRDWNDVAVDKFSNLLVVPEEVPENESYDDLRAFDRLLRDSPASRRSLRQSELTSRLQQTLPDPSEFQLEDDDDET